MLLEMLVALAIFSLAALALIRLQAVAVRSAADLDDRQMARITAHNLMVDAQTSPDILAPGESRGEVQNGGRTWHWVRRVSRTGEGGLLRVDLSLRSKDEATATALSFLRENPS
ncbi:MAG: type II secretion system protein GspI [Sphingobium sp.]|nr:type II secretion system protein GspI [Sphingobium sp.]